MRFSRPFGSLTIFAVLVALFVITRSRATEGLKASASSSAEGFAAGGAIDANRFSGERNSAWKGQTNATHWWWQVEFEKPRTVGAILQVVGDHDFVFHNAPRRSVWQSSNDGQHWSDLAQTVTTNETRLYRIQRLRKPVIARYLRLDITDAAGEFPTVREVEFFANPKERIAFPDWIVAVNTTHFTALPTHGQEFIPLAKSCPGWEQLQAQQISLPDFDEDFLRAEPRPLCAFLSGNFKDWCEVDREIWRGTQQILVNKNLPMWASCGGAQGLALVADTGVDKPWDCPHCRDAKNPKTPIYGHIGHTARRPCGDYSGCIMERGPHWVRAVSDDPVFKNLAKEFQVMESHCGQIEWPPAGWSLTATAGKDTKTKTQCLRMNDRLIYAAQFHIEMQGTPEASKQIMANFLALAKSWGGYNSQGASVPAPASPTKP